MDKLRTSSILVILQALLIGRCEGYTYSTTWWSVWYFWVVLFCIVACCCGAIGSYYRRRRFAQLRRSQHTVVVGGVPAGSQPQAYPGQNPAVPVAYPPYSANPTDPYAPPPFPTGPVQPPAYSEGMGNQGYQGGNKDDLPQPPPPAYHEVVGETVAQK